MSALRSAHRSADNPLSARPTRVRMMGWTAPERDKSTDPDGPDQNRRLYFSPPTALPFGGNYIAVWFGPPPPSGGLQSIFWAGSLMSQVLQWTQFCALITKCGSDFEAPFAVDDLIDPGGAVEASWFAIHRQVVADRERS